MHRSLLILLAFLHALPLARAQMVKNPARRGEFPGLSLLPKGSVVRDISLPRYENRRVVAHIMADLLEVIDSGRVSLTGIRSSMYAENGEETILTMDKADYHFEKEMMKSNTRVTVENPRFRATGTAVSYSNARRQGLVRGPVHTLFNTEALTESPPKKNTR